MGEHGVPTHPLPRLAEAELGDLGQAGDGEPLAHHELDLHDARAARRDLAVLREQRRLHQRLLDAFESGGARRLVGVCGGGRAQREREQCKNDSPHRRWLPRSLLELDGAFPRTGPCARTVPEDDVVAGTVSLGRTPGSLAAHSLRRHGARYSPSKAITSSCISSSGEPVK